MRLAFTYPLYGLFFQLLMRLKPSFTAKRRAHMQFTKQKVDERLNRNTERKDFLQYVKPLHFHYQEPFLIRTFRFSVAEKARNKVLVMTRY